MWLCSELVYDRVQKEDPQNNKDLLWKAEAREIPDCKYDVYQVPTSPEAKYVHLQIFQRDCKDQEFSQKSPGGSSFYVLSEGLYQQICEIRDLLNNYYDVICFHQPLFLNALSSPSSYFHADILEKLTFCQFITIILDFEHFDAFNERAAYAEKQYPYLQTTLIEKQEFCLKYIESSKSGNRKLKIVVDDPAPSDIKVFHDPKFDEWILKITNEFLSTSNAITNGCWMLHTIPTSHFQFRLALKDSSSYAWKWQTDFRGSDAARLPCLSNISSLLSKDSAQEDFYFFGESHLRYSWDYLIEQIDPSVFETVLTDRKHSNGDFQNFHFLEIHFAVALSNAFNSWCSSSPSPHSSYFVLQTGTWDLTFWPPSQVIENPASGHALVDSLRNILNIDSSSPPCSSSVSSSPVFIWVDTVPYPICQSGLRPSSVEGDSRACYANRMARNNYAINAVNYFYETSLQGLNANAQEKMKSNVFFVKSREVILPRLLYASFLCKNHFLCRELNMLGVAKTPEGVIVAESILRLLCSIKHKG